MAALDKLDEAQQAWRQMNRTQRREFLRWANEWQDARRRTRDAPPVEKEFAAMLAKMDVSVVGEPQQG